MHPFIMRSAGWGLNTLAALSPAAAGKKGFELFCRPFRGKLKAHHLQFLQSARQFTVPLNNEWVQCYQWGDGDKTVLLLHGWQSHSFRWRAYVDLLVQHGYTVYALDAPGHGLSKGNQLNLLLYSQLVTEFLYRHARIDHLIAHSFGGYASIYALHQTPGLPVQKMVLMGTPCSVADFMNMYEQMLGLKPKTKEAILQYFVDRIGHLPEHFEAANLVQTFTKPVLFVHDTEDADAPYHQVAAMHKLWHNATLLTTDGLGHELKSTELAHQVLAYLEEA
jgi:pimeloyl-ACP methyl ester carboxylesterase